MKWSPQQQAFLNWCETGTGSCVLEAVAGAGKTTTLVEGIHRIQGSVALVAFNKKISVELEERLKALGLDWKKARAGTVHSFGNRAYRKVYPKAVLNKRKVDDLINGQSEIESEFSTMIVKLVGLAKQRAVGVIGRIDDVNAWAEIADHFDVFETRDGQELPELAIIAAAQRVLRASIAKTDVIDFNDMIYMPLVLSLPFWRYDAVLIDEAQDTNPARRELVKRMLKRGGRVIAVGDRHQAIYGFTGADNDSLDLIAKEWDCERLPLTTTYRCPKSVVNFAKQWVSHINAHESAPEGSVTSMGHDEFVKQRLNGNSAVLCRNTKPLVAMAFTLIRARIACKIEGRDVSENLTKLINRWKVKSLDALAGRLDKYLERETAKLTAKGQDAKLQQVEDLVETIRVIIDQCLSEGKNTVADAIKYTEELFADDVRGILVLSTIHKSKGREWEQVFWLDRSATCPSKYAKQDWQIEQEANLCYVAATRAKSQLIEISTPSRPSKVSVAAAPSPVKETQAEARKRRRLARKARGEAAQ